MTPSTQPTGPSSVAIITTILFFVWALALILAIWSMLLARRFATRIPRLAVAPPQADAPTPQVAVILPIKGVDDDSPANLRALLAQDYPAYRLIFAVESADDHAVALIERLTADEPAGKVEVVVAGLAESRGQKVHNQLAAVERTTDRDEILAFMDADARPAPAWLRALVTPLAHGSHIGATTGYRYYVPETPTAPNAIVSVINAGVALLFGPYRRSFVWGGSMALRRHDFFDYGIHSAWQNAVSDDYVVSHCVRNKARARIHFVPRCLVASSADFNWGSLLEFATRQYRITRICAPLPWLAAITGPSLYLLVLGYTFIRMIQSAVIPLGGERGMFEPFIAGVMFASLYTLTIIRGRFILAGAQKLLPDHYPAVRTTAFYLTFGYPFVQAVNLACVMASAFGRTIVWRGITYTMISRTHTRVRRPVRISQTANAPEPRDAVTP